jgi:sugar phosphate isomerase/epimerase
MNHPIYDASLSTMWAGKNFSTLRDFFQGAEKMGFSRIELNYQINSKMLRDVDLDKYTISSVHEPCPADISVETLKAKDWLISSLDKDCRRQGVAAIKRSIELASKLNAKTVIIHAGTVSQEMILEDKLRRLFNANLTETAEYQNIKSDMIERRFKLLDHHLEATAQSLQELLIFANQFDVCLGLENRYHYFDIPTQEEMSVLLELAGPEKFGFIYDIGHATAMNRLGFFKDEQWLKSFGKRMIGCHLHDVIGISDHHAPGMGDVDFKFLAGYLPNGSFRTIEVKSSTTPRQIKTGLKKLMDADCVNIIQ